MTSTRRAPDEAPSSGGAELTALPTELEDELFATWLDDDRASAERGLRALCDRHPEHAAELHRVAQRLDRAGGECARAARTEVPLPWPERIGPYRVLEELGCGAFGVVWLAEQTEPLRRRVAVKVLLPTVLGAGHKVLRRFETERQTLAQMHHPGIANILDAGTTQSGEPYFVMEFVPGEPITRYCDQHKLAIDQRLELFLQVCSAVQHAHQNGVIHRDLKPGNILVRDDGEPLAKVIDFGLAKALESGASDEAGITEEGRFVGTPEYMSPEQACGGPVDTRTDIYALGVLLYEILTGELPIGSSALRAGDWSTTLRVLREQEPLRPSEVLARSASGVAAIAELRRTGEDELKRRLRGDLNWIAMTALAKDRERRYSDVAALAADVQRHLDDRPVSVGPPKLGYVVGKFARRHRAGVAAASIVAVLLVVATIGAFVAVAEIVASRIEAEQRQKDAESSLYAAQIAVAQAALESGRARPMREALRRAPAELRGWEWRLLAGQSDQSATVHHVTAGELRGPALLDGGAAVVVATKAEEQVVVKAWDLASGRERFAFPAASSEVFHLSSSTDGRFFAVGYTYPAEVRLHRGSGGEPVLWVRDGEVVPAVIPMEHSHATSAFDPQGELLAVAARDSIRLFDVATGEERSPDRAMHREKADIQDLVFCADGSRLVSCSNSGGVTIWDVRTGSHRYVRFASGTGTVRRVAVDPRDRFIAAACPSEDAVRVCSLDDGSVVHVLRPDHKVTAVAFSSDGGFLVSGHGDGSVTYWDPEKGREIGTSAGHVGFVDGLALAPDGAPISASWDGTVRVWDPSPRRVGSRPFDDAMGVTRVALHPSRSLAILAPWVPGLVACNPETHEILWQVDGDSVTDLALAGDQVFAGLLDGRVARRDVSTGALLAEAHVFDRAVERLVASSDRGLLAVSFGDTLSVRDAVTLESIRDFTGLGSRPLTAFVSGRTGAPRLLIGARSLRIVDPVANVVQLEEPLPAPATGLAVSPDGRTFAVADGSGRLVLHDAATGRAIRTLHDPDATETLTTLTFSPGGERLAAADNRNFAVRVFDPQRNLELLSLYDHDAWCNQLVFGPRGRRLFVAAGAGADCRLRVWEAPELTQLPR